MPSLEVLLGYTYVMAFHIVHAYNERVITVGMAGSYWQVLLAGLVAI